MTLYPFVQSVALLFIWLAFHPAFAEVVDGKLREKADARKADYLLKTCHELSTLVGGTKSAERYVDPATEVAYGKDPATVTTSVLNEPRHGTIVPFMDVDLLIYHYTPESGYLGKDQVTFMAEYRGKTYRVVINLLVEYVTDGNSPQCPKPQLIKLTMPSSTHRGPTHHSTGPARKAAQAGEFKRWAY